MPNRFAVTRVLAVVIASGMAVSVSWGQNEIETVPAKPAATAAQPGATPAAAAQPDPKVEQRRLAGLLTDFIHYVRIHNFELAAASAKALLDSGLTDEQLAALISDRQSMENDFIDAVIRSQSYPEIETLASALQKRHQLGLLAISRNAAQITRNIQLLTGTQNERFAATNRLKEAGEYAMPQLFAALLDRADPSRQAQVRRVVVQMGRHAIIPLCTALAQLEPNNQELVAGVLGDLENPYTTSLPFLYETWGKASNDRVRRACEQAIMRISGAVNPEIPVSTRFETLAVEYYNESRSLTSFPGEPVQLLWNFDPGSGLFATPVATPVYHEAMAMKMSERSLVHNPANTEALSLWIAANFSREIDTPEGYTNPAYGADRRDATYYAVAAGSQVSERVLARAIDSRDTQLARRSIAAIEQTAGAKAMTESAVRRPLLEALAYPNRPVQYDAALAIGSAQPANEFAGSERIVPTLASAIRDASARYAVVLSGEPNDQNALREQLSARGYTVLPPGTSLSDIAQPLAETPGVDLVVSQLPAAQTDAMIQEVRSRPGLAATPILALVSLQGYMELAKKYEDDISTKVSREGITPEQAAAAADQLIEASVGGAISEGEARDYQLRSLAVLRDLAVSGNQALKVSYAAGPLTSAIGTNSGDVKLKIAEVMSYINDKSVQVALMDAAMDSTGDERISLLGYVAGSAKRYGNQLEQRQVNNLVKLATNAETDAEATAAAALMGALNLPNTDLVPVILGNSAKK